MGESGPDQPVQVGFMEIILKDEMEGGRGMNALQILNNRNRLFTAG